MISFKNLKKGFTLIEMIVSLAIFSVVAVVALGAMMRIMSANQKAQAIQSAVTNLGFALEAMSREMRVGNSIHPLISGNTNEVSFLSTKSTADCPLRYYSYRFHNDNVVIHLQKAENCGSQTFNDDDFIDITSPNIVITSGNFNVSDGDYKLIYITLAGYAGAKEKNRTYFNIRTAVSVRAGE